MTLRNTLPVMGRLINKSETRGMIFIRGLCGRFRHPRGVRHTPHTSYNVSLPRKSRMTRNPFKKRDGHPSSGFDVTVRNIRYGFQDDRLQPSTVAFAETVARTREYPTYILSVRFVTYTAAPKGTSSAPQLHRFPRQRVTDCRSGLLPRTAGCRTQKRSAGR